MERNFMVCSWDFAPVTRTSKTGKVRRRFTVVLVFMIVMVLVDIFIWSLPSGLAVEPGPIPQVVAVRYPSGTKGPAAGVVPGGQFILILSTAHHGKVSKFA
jgi:hypothetical protein